jgi:hypothetical protein
MYGFQSIAVTSMGISQYTTVLPFVPKVEVEPWTEACRGISAPTNDGLGVTVSFVMRN